jgi:perosamine synthetase
MNREPIPRLPVFGWQALAGAREAPTPCLLNLPGLHYATSGRAAILLALEALGIGPGDTVLVPTYHCPTMVAPAASRGASIRFYPIDEFGAPCVGWLEQQDLRGARALLAAHFFGLPQPMARIRNWCRERGIALIEDCAHALFGRSGDRQIGAWGDMAIASLTKFLPVPEGGCLIVNQGSPSRVPALQPCSAGPQLRAAMDIVEVGAAQGRLTGLNAVISGTLAAMRALRGSGRQVFADSSVPAEGGMNRAVLPATDMRIDAALAHRQLSAASRWVGTLMPRERIVVRRRMHYAALASRLTGHAGLHPLLPTLPTECAPYVFPLWVEKPDPGYAELRRLRMPVFRWDRLWPGVPALEGDHGTRWSHHVLQLACHQDLDDADINQFVATLLRLYQR